MNMPDKPLLDIKRVIANKNPKLADRIPKFVYDYLGRLIHQKELNHIFSTAIDNDITGTRFATYALSELGTKYEAHGLENIPDSGRFIFASNHPLGGLDAMVMIDCISKRFPNLKFIVNDVLMHIAPMKEIFLPINKFGRQSQEYARSIRENLASDDQLLIFPAGLCSRKIDGEVKDIKWRNSFVKMAVSGLRDIVPVYFEGLNSKRFYRIANWRKKLGIKFNIEMILLPDEMFRQRSNNLNIYFGKPISFQTFDSSRSMSDWCQYVRENVYCMAN